MAKEVQGLTVRSLITAVGGVIAGIIAISLILGVVGFNKAGESVIIQYPNGNLKAITKAGPFGKWWGDCKVYRNYATVGFGTKHKENSSISAEFAPVPVPFSDNTMGHISATLRVALPTNETALLKIRNEYAGGYEAFVANGVVPVVQNAIKLSANLRTSQEGVTTLAVFQRDIEDQLMLGIYETRSVEKWIHKSTGDSERVRITEIVLDTATKMPVRRSTVLQQLGCSVTQCQIDVPQFDAGVQEMLKQRRDQSIQTEISKQSAVRAVQDRITSEEQGKAAVMKVKYEKEKEKQAAVTDAEKDTMVAYLVKKAAEYYKQSAILKGEGEAEARKLAMNADGALKIKIDALVEVNKIWAAAYQACPNRPTPDVVFNGAGASGGTGNAAMNFMDMQNVRALKDFQLDMAPHKR